MHNWLAIYSTMWVPFERKTFTHCSSLNNRTNNNPALGDHEDRMGPYCWSKDTLYSGTKTSKQWKMINPRILKKIISIAKAWKSFALWWLPLFFDDILAGDRGFGRTAWSADGQSPLAVSSGDTSFQTTVTEEKTGDDFQYNRVPLWRTPLYQTFGFTVQRPWPPIFGAPKSTEQFNHAVEVRGKATVQRQPLESLESSG